MDNHLNFVTMTALLSWPLVGLWLFSTRSIVQATLWVILGGYLLLPVRVEINFPGIPAFDKTSIPNLVAYAGCMLALRKPVRLYRNFGLAELMILTMLISLFLTSATNTDSILNGRMVMPGITMYDAFSSIAYQLIVLIPFFLGRELLRDERSVESVLRTLVLAGLAYTPLMLFEIRMSPQLHTWLYGYFPGPQFSSEVRPFGFRPVVFLTNGILASFFLMTSAVAATALWRAGKPILAKARVPAGIVTGWLSLTLLLCQSLAAIVYGAFSMFLVFFTRPRLQIKLAIALTCIALLYPTLRAADLVPTKSILTLAGMVNDTRQQSLETRFTNEDALLTRASQRFWFGWGKWGRNLIYDRWGNLATRIDGAWIIAMSASGYVGFLALFGLLSLAIFKAASALRFVTARRERTLFAGLIVILAINIVDLIPNASFSPWSWLMLGALLGRSESLVEAARQRKHRVLETQSLTSRRPAVTTMVNASEGRGRNR